tara:strand:- start:572 stop:988 length:417 start_codon:yes stop_codon:yes gene_type:complete
MKKDLDFIAKLEKAIQDKYGEDAIQNPKKYWNEEKEIEHDKHRKEFYKRKYFKKLKTTKENYKGFLVNKKLLTKDNERHCPVCGEYSFDGEDDFYMTRFSCCFKCYIQYVEHREERWSSGWRPHIKEQESNGDNTRSN